jgi:4-coumarate--CoA ligase
MHIYKSIYPPPHLRTDISISQFFSLYNPDAVLGDKVILEDDWTGMCVTYRGLREGAARHAWVLRDRWSVGVGDVVVVCGENSVSFPVLLVFRGLSGRSWGRKVSWKLG